MSFLGGDVDVSFVDFAPKAVYLPFFLGGSVEVGEKAVKGGVEGGKERKDGDEGDEEAVEPGLEQE